MNNFKKLILLFVCMVFCSFAFGEEKVCEVPVCDIEQTVTELTELNENQRYNFVNKLVVAHKESKDPVVLENLIAAADAFKKLSKQLGDADWVVRESSTLANNSIFNLAKYSEVNAQKMTALFKRLDNATKRYEVIAYWQGEISSIENVSILNELVIFADNAKEHTLSVGDEDWIPRAAGKLASDTTVKLTSLDPVHEGVYKVSIEGEARKYLAFDQVVILDSSSEKNLMVYFLNTRFNRVVFSYRDTLIVGNTIKGKTLPNNDMSSQFSLSFDRQTGDIKGIINTTRSKNIYFSGKQVFTNRTVFQGATPYMLEPNDAIGDFVGQIYGVKGVLSIESFSPNKYSASFVADNGALVIDFQGKFFPKNGVISLTHGNKVKLTIALRETDAGVVWRGYSYSTQNGKVVEATFQPLR